jgi:putative redox protein
MTLGILASVDPARLRVDSRTPLGHLVRLDSEPSAGADGAPEPKEALLAALAGCTSMDVASILLKKRQSVERYEVAVTGESASEHPRVFTAIRIEHRVSGGVSAEALRRSIELSATRYCPVNAMLSAATEIEHRYVLTDASGARHEAVVAVTGPTGSRVL